MLLLLLLLLLLLSSVSAARVWIPLLHGSFPAGEPSPPANLSVLMHEEELSVSWSSPWSPPGITLSYTVTFLHNSSQREIDYHTTNTTLTVKGTDLAGESSELAGLCELYVLQVVAESPAGVGLASEENVPVFHCK